jgi:hypothetical protein
MSNYVLQFDPEETKIAMPLFMDQCQPYLQQEMLHHMSDGMLKATANEALRFSRMHKVCPQFTE